jgi:hypothetical protein
VADLARVGLGRHKHIDPYGKRNALGYGTSTARPRSCTRYARSTLRQRTSRLPDDNYRAHRRLRSTHPAPVRLGAGVVLGALARLT